MVRRLFLKDSSPIFIYKKTSIYLLLLLLFSLQLSAADRFVNFDSGDVLLNDGGGVSICLDDAT